MSGYTYSRWFTDEEIMADMEEHCRREDERWAEYERRKKEIPPTEPDKYTEQVCAIADELGL